MSNLNLVILSYHRFCDQESDYPFSRTFNQFRHDIRKKTFDWITIDDGRSCQIKACAMMKELNIRAKLFICTSLVGGPNYCTWEQIRELSKFHDIENHSHVHEWHNKLSDHQIRESMTTAQYLITKEIGKAPRYFVPPYNNYTFTVLDVAKELGLQPIKDRINIKNTSK